jgi:transcriptional regulator with XRE-family HTH domain
MPPASTSSLGVGTAMPPLSQIVSYGESPNFHNLCVPHLVTECDKNGGPNYLRAWREFRKMTQEKLAESVGTNANMIQYLETGERGLSAKWLRRLAPELDTTPGLLLDHDPETLDSDLLEIYAHGDDRQRRQMSEIAKTLVRTGTGG